MPLAYHQSLQIEKSQSSLCSSSRGQESCILTMMLIFFWCSKTYKKYNKENMYLIWTIKNANLLAIGFTSFPNLKSSSTYFYNILYPCKNLFLQELTMTQYFLLRIWAIPGHTQFILSVQPSLGTTESNCIKEKSVGKKRTVVFTVTVFVCDICFL